MAEITSGISLSCAVAVVVPCLGVALACAHNETETLEHLFDQGAEKNTASEDEVPPIVAATIGDSKEAAEVLLMRGTASSSSFTGRYGHVLFLAIISKSSKVLRLLLDHIRNSSDPAETERGLSELSIHDLRSEDTMRMMLEAEVKLDTPLKDGTMLTTAIHHGWKDSVRQLLKQGADVNMRFETLRTGRPAFYDDALEASLRHKSYSVRGQLDSLVYLLIDEHRARISARHVGAACEFERHKLVSKLLGRHLGLNEIYTLNGTTTSALIQAVISGSEKTTRLLIENNADVNVQVGGLYGDAISAAFWTMFPFSYSSLTRCWVSPITEALIQGGASLDKLAGDRLNIALAAAAHAGLEDTAQECLKFGAEPNAAYRHQYNTALGAAAASDHPGALDT